MNKTMLEPPVGLQALQLIQYKDPLERWEREDWLELGDILDSCSTDHDDCRCGRRRNCQHLMSEHLGVSPMRFGYNEKANAKSRDGGYWSNRNGSWIPTLKIKGSRDIIIKC